MTRHVAAAALFFALMLTPLSARASQTCAGWFFPIYDVLAAGGAALLALPLFLSHDPQWEFSAGSGAAFRLDEVSHAASGDLTAEEMAWAAERRKDLEQAVMLVALDVTGSHRLKGRWRYVTHISNLHIAGGMGCIETRTETALGVEYQLVKKKRLPGKMRSAGLYVGAAPSVGVHAAQGESMLFGGQIWVGGIWVLESTDISLRLVYAPTARARGDWRLEHGIKTELATSIGFDTGALVIGVRGELGFTDNGIWASELLYQPRAVGFVGWRFANKKRVHFTEIEM